MRKDSKISRPAKPSKGLTHAKKASRPITATSPRKAGKKRSHEFALTMREKISENWVAVRKGRRT